MKITKRTAVRATVALATVAIGAGITAGAADAAGTSTNYSTDLKIAKHSTIVYSTTCQAGTHIRGGWGFNPGTGDQNGAFIPGVNDTNGWVGKTEVPTPTSPYTDGSDGLYRGFSVTLHNYDLVSSHTTTVSWTCDAN